MPVRKLLSLWKRPGKRKITSLYHYLNPGPSPKGRGSKRVLDSQYIGMQ